MPAVRGLIMMLSEAGKYLAYARECLQLAEKATEPDIQNSLIELSHIWMEAALQEEKRQLELTPGGSHSSI
jgi:hypothetical protein